MDTIKQYRLRNKQSGKVYRHMTLQDIMNKLHLGYSMAKDFISGDILVKKYRKHCIIKRLSHWSTREDILPKGTLIKNADGTFKKGVPMFLGHKWTKGNNYRHPKGYRAAPQTEFKPGQTPPNFKGIGVPRINQHRRDGPTIVTTIPETIAAVSRGRKYVHKKRTSYARWVFGLGEIPKGCIVYHKDGDQLNNTPGNLICISRAELLKINRMGGYV